MTRKSDKSGAARSRRGRISATKAGRSFSRVLEEVEQGKSFVVYRRGKDVCQMGPVTCSGRTVSDCLQILRSRPEVHLDDRFGSDLIAIISAEPAEKRPWD